MAMAEPQNLSGSRVASADIVEIRRRKAENLNIEASLIGPKPRHCGSRRRRRQHGCGGGTRLLVGVLPGLQPGWLRLPRASLAGAIAASKYMLVAGAARCVDPNSAARRNFETCISSEGIVRREADRHDDLVHLPLQTGIRCQADVIAWGSMNIGNRSAEQDLRASICQSGMHICGCFGRQKPVQQP